MKNFRFYAILALLALSCTVNISAQSWYVCMGSFRTKENALHLQEKLEDQDIYTFIVSVRTERGLFYRVLATQDDGQVNTASSSSAVRQQDALVKKAAALGITNLWVCKADQRNAYSPALKNGWAPSPQGPATQHEPAAVALIPEATAEPQTAAPTPEAQPEPQTAASTPEATAEPQTAASAPEVQPEPQTAASTPEAQPEPQTAAPVQLTQNIQTTDFSAQAPYTVLINTYREEEHAIHDRDRLLSQNIDAYVMGLYDQGDLFRFNLQAGAFSTTQEAELLAGQIKETGVPIQGITDYNTLEQKINDYNRVVQETPVVSEAGATEIPAILSQSIRSCLLSFPVNRDYQIEKIELYDTDNILATGASLPDTGLDLSSFIHDTSNGMVHAVSYAEYKDSLFGKTVEVIIFECESDFTQYILGEINSSTETAKVPVTLEAPGQVFDCSFFPDTEHPGSYSLTGTNQDKTMLITMKASDFTEEQFISFMTNAYSDGSLLVYPQVRRNLYILPSDQRAQRTFLFYTLGRVPETYARERDYSNWAVPIVGHWNSGANFDLDGHTITVGFFNMDYDYNASFIHSLFMKEKQNAHISDSNHPEDVNTSSGWYLENFRSKELSFSKDSYIIAVDSDYYDASISLQELKDLALDLKIWNQAPNPRH